jgi:hypothetical protein
MLKARELAAVISLKDGFHVYQGHQDVAGLKVFEKEVPGGG